MCRLTSFKQIISKSEASQTHDYVGKNELSDWETLQQFASVNEELIELDTDDCLEQWHAEFNDFEYEYMTLLPKRDIC